VGLTWASDRKAKRKSGLDVAEFDLRTLHRQGRNEYRMAFIPKLLRSGNSKVNAFIPLPLQAFCGKNGLACP
jgi:hypothetical protein